MADQSLNCESVTRSNYPPMDAINQAIAEAETEGMWVDELPPMEAIEEAMERASR